MISINGRKFAKNDSEFVDSLFNNDGTCDGYYKVMKRNIMFYDMQKKPSFTVTVNKWNEVLFSNARQLDDGKIWYSYLGQEKAKYLGIESLVTQDDIAKSLAREYLNY